MSCSYGEEHVTERVEHVTEKGKFSYDKGEYSFVTFKKGIELFQNKNKDISIIDVDLELAEVSFGGLVQDGKFYKKFFANEMLTYAKNPFNIFGVVNGGFFLDVQDEKRTGLSFPIKSSGYTKATNPDYKMMFQPIKETYIDNEIPKRTIVITQNGNVKIFEGYTEEILNNDEYKEVSVAFSPEVTARRNDRVGRSYIGITCSEEDKCKNIIFFIADNKNQEEMDRIIADYGVERQNIIMMDGGPSAQFSYMSDKYMSKVGRTVYGKWRVPQFNIIYEKQ